MSAAPGRPKQARTEGGAEGSPVTASPPAAVDAGPPAAAPRSRRRPRVWGLRGHLSALLLVTMSVTFSLVGLALMVWRVPEIERQHQEALRGELRDVAVRMELLLGARQSRLELLAALVQGRRAADARAVVEGAGDGAHLFEATYLVSAQGRVLAAALAPGLPGPEGGLLGRDLSSHALFRDAHATSGVVWRGRHRSMLTGDFGIGLAYRAPDGQVLVGEMPLSSLVGALQSAAGQRASSIWVVERSGDVIADNQRGRHIGTLNIAGWPLMQAALLGRAPPHQVRFEGQKLTAAVAHAEALDWYIVGSVPAGWDDPAVRRAAAYVLGAFLGCLLVGLAVAPFWARRMTRSLQGIVARAALAKSGLGGEQSWPRGSVIEFNRLSADVQAVAETLQDREQKSLAIFNASPVPMTVANPQDGLLLEVNEAWCREFRHRREDVLGRTSVEVGLLTEHERQRLLALAHDGMLATEATVRRGDGEPMQVQVFAQMVDLRSGRLLMWATMDIGPLRRVERALRDLNQQLEARVARRTSALQAANEELSRTVAQLRAAQGDLVRAEKMAALGNLVAGVAHELNTPLGNGVMAVSAMRDATRHFRLRMADGVRKADLQGLVDNLAQGFDIGERNLRRASDLVHSFKQVAVDQTSSQRRRFELAEVVHGIVVSLRPSLAHTPWRIEVAVPAEGLALDSYPGPLGQVIANLLQNAVLHGFDGRAHGTVRITGERASDGHIVLQVADDGNGIADTLVDRVFEPFMTTRRGRGGSGLGLHISDNLVTSVLGGTLAVRSVQGAGATFELRLPAQAPRQGTAP
jgi:PAS domain S-box-containing protein